jgi:pimeloyl-ACP methyl ester carboxylesterase
MTFDDPEFGKLTLPNMQGLTIYGRQAAPPNKSMELSIGKVWAREYGVGNSKFAVALHSVYSTGSEWQPVGEQLAERGWYFLIPNWSGNKITDPALCYEEQGEWPRWQKQAPVYAALLDEILDQTGYKKFDALLGFSWGGWIATMRAARYPQTVGKLVLVAPAFLEEDSALSPNFAGYIPSGTSGKELAKMGNPKVYLNKLCANVFGKGGRAALDTEVINGSLRLGIHGLAKNPTVKPPAWGEKNGAIVACKKADDCIGDHRWARAVTSKYNHKWPSSPEEFSGCDKQCDQVVCAMEPPSIAARTAIFWGEQDSCVDFENTKWFRTIFKHEEKFYHESGKHCVHPNYESRIVAWVDEGRPIGSLRRLTR